MLARFGCSSASRRNGLLIADNEDVWLWLSSDEDWLREFQNSCVQRLKAGAPLEARPALEGRAAKLLCAQGLSTLRAIAQYHASLSFLEAYER